MKKSFFLGLLLISNILYAQKDSLWNLDGVSNVTVMLYQKFNDTAGINGSASIVNHNGKYFLLTANHVAKEMKNDASIVFRVNGDKPAILKLVSTVKDHKLSWVNHPVADLSLIELATNDKNIQQRLTQWSFPSNQIHGGKDLPQKDADITF